MEKKCGRKRKLKEFIEDGETILDPYEDTRKPYLKLPSLRTPIRNCIPNYFVPKKLYDRRGKKKSNKAVNNNNNNNDGPYHDLVCDCCGNHDQSRFIQDKQNCPVCENCGVVKTSEVTYSNELSEMQAKDKQSYQRRSYLSERLRQFTNSEPRISEPDLEIIRHAYARLREAFNEGHPLFKRSTRTQKKYIKGIVESFTSREEDITKQHIKSLLDFIDGSMEKNVSINPYGIEKRPSFKKKYLERWAQIKRYFCGDTYYYNYLVTKPDQITVDLLFKIATLVTIVYETKEQYKFVLETDVYSRVKEEEDEEFLIDTAHLPDEQSETICCGMSFKFFERKQVPPTLDDPPPLPVEKKKRNIPSLDLLFLMILYADSDNSVEVHGWYFVKKIAHEYTYTLPAYCPDVPIADILEARKKKRDTKYSALRRDFLALKKILTHLNTHQTKTLSNIPELEESVLRIPKNISQIVRLAARNTASYQYPTS